MEKSILGFINNKSRNAPQLRVLWRRIVILLGILLCLNLLFGGILIIIVLNSINLIPYQNSGEGEITYAIIEFLGNMQWRSSIGNQYALIAIITLAALLVLIYWFVGRKLILWIFNPLDDLRKIIEQIGKGVMDPVIPIDNKDEIRNLAIVFRDLVERLMAREQQVAAQNALLENEVAERKNAQEALSVLNEELEERVIQRTIELTRVNEELLHEVNEKNIAKNALQKKSYQQERLLEIAHQLTQSLNVKQVLHNIATGARDILDANGCTIYFLEDDNTTLTPVVAIEPPFEEEILAMPLHVEHSLTGQAILARHGLVFNNALSAEGGQQIPGTPEEIDERVITVPLMVDDKVLGAICLSRLGKEFTGEDLTLAETFAIYASTALKNAQAHDSLQQEVVERKFAQEALRVSEERFSLAVRGANDGIWDWDLRTNQVYFSPRWQTMLGYDEGEIGYSPEDWFKLIHPEDIDRFKADVNSHLTGKTINLKSEYRILQKNGTYCWVLCRGLAIRNGDHQAYRMAGSMTDITETKTAEASLLYNALHDSLTNLPNRTLFMDRLGRAIDRTRRKPGYLAAALLLDLDRFKVINDSLGHALGDQFLIATSQRLQNCLRPTDTVARFGGDEFVILLDDINQASDATRAAERILEEISLPVEIRGHQVVTTASIGIALTSTGYSNPDEMMRDADTAMYRAKAGGKARHEVFDKKMHRQILAIMQREAELRRAIDQKELEVQYQPIISLNDGTIVGCEALLRWNHPNLGVLNPNDFIQIAEETGLIVSIGKWVLKTACSEAREWLNTIDQNFFVSINLSSRQFLDNTLQETIRIALEESQLPASSLYLEVTESAAMHDIEMTSRILRQVSDTGVKIAIDDFGRGYSALGYLTQFPVDTIKIDRSFIQDIGINERISTITTAMIMMAHVMHMRVIAEGVETEDQLAFLFPLQCEMVQGFRFCHACTGETMKKFLDEKRDFLSEIRIKQNVSQIVGIV
ncbi:MAG: EAL domain-containing protein [Chloroflexi bacterium]|nr:EAL domain-containing protein [Chloroflexota bacterium]